MTSSLERRRNSVLGSLLGAPTGLLDCYTLDSYTLDSYTLDWEVELLHVLGL